jgi:hypothetical protein
MPINRTGTVACFIVLSHPCVRKSQETVSQPSREKSNCCAHREDAGVDDCPTYVNLSRE